MGCTASTDYDANHHPCVVHRGVVIDDSIHAMLVRDRRIAKHKGLQAPTGYRPRAPHPLLSQTARITATEDDNTIFASENSSESSIVRLDDHHPHHVVSPEMETNSTEEEEEEEVNRMLFHTKHLCDLVDARDVVVCTRRGAAHHGEGAPPLLYTNHHHVALSTPSA
jgi:hypothetical protein